MSRCSNLVAAFIVGLCVVLGATIHGVQQNRHYATLSFTAFQQVDGVPDLAIIRAKFVLSNQKSVDAGLKSVQEKNTKIKEKLASFSIKSDDIDASFPLINKELSFENGHSPSLEKESESQDSYTATQYLTITTKNIAKIDAIVGALSELNFDIDNASSDYYTPYGHGVVLTSSMYEKHVQEARLLAVEKVKKQVEAFAKRTNAKLEISSIYANESYMKNPNYNDPAILALPKSPLGLFTTVNVSYIIR